MKALLQLSSQLGNGQDLTQEQAAEAARELTSPACPFEDKRLFLTALNRKGETAAEVAAFATTFRELTRNPQLEAWAPRAIDIVGTGGSGSGSYNISSVAAITVAAAGLPVIKHGNRAVTSKSGAADFMGILGAPLNPPLELLRESMERLNFCFLFAPSFHPAFKEIVPVRKALAEEGQRTIFNILGPLINPARPAYELLGVFSSAWVRPLANALHWLRLKRGLAVHAEFEGQGGVDEFSCAGRNRVVGFGDFGGLDTVWLPRDLGLADCKPEDIKGGDAEQNFAMLLKIVDGEGPRGLTDTIILNAGIGIWIANGSDDVKHGIQIARDVLLKGKVAEWIQQAQAFYGKAKG